MSVTYLEKAVKQPNGGDSTIWDHLGDCYSKLSKKDKAIDAWQKALKDARSDAKPDKKLLGKIEKKLKEAGVKVEPAASTAKPDAKS